MCTLVLRWTPDAAWPLIAAANRDELLTRPWRPPAPHWPAQPDVVGGLDLSAGGTWLAVRRDGMLAAVLNRTFSLGPAPGKRSRGELPLTALTHATAAKAAAALSAMERGMWRPFNLVIADRSSAWCLISDTSRLRCQKFDSGLHMVASGDPDDSSDRRIAAHAHRFAAATPVPPDWGSWPMLLSDPSGDPHAAMNIHPNRGFGTSSGCLIALGATTEFAFAAAPLHPDAFCPVPV